MSNLDALVSYSLNRDVIANRKIALKEGQKQKHLVVVISENEDCDFVNYNILDF